MQADYNQYYSQLTGDTLQTIELDEELIYIGQCAEKIALRFAGQFTYFLPTLQIGNFEIPFNKSIGINAQFERIFENFQSSNFTLWLPVVLRGKSKDKHINVELQARWNDYTGSLFKNKSDKEKFSVGLNLALPFNSAIY